VYAIPVIRCHTPVDDRGNAHNRGWDTIAAYGCAKFFSMERHDVFPRVAITLGINIDPFAGAEVYARPGADVYPLPAIDPATGGKDPHHNIGRIRRHGGHLRFEVNVSSWQAVGPWVAQTIRKAIVDASVLPDKLDISKLEPVYQAESR
jgi:hypothetical protein